MSERCELCRFWFGTHGNSYRTHGGICRRNAPIGGPTGKVGDQRAPWHWPAVPFDAWCGKYVPNDAELARQRKEAEDEITF